MPLPSRPTDLAGLPAAAFIRVSTDQQQASPATQRRIIERFVAKYDLHLVLTRQLIGVSGKDAWRDPAVMEITEAAERGQIRAVIVAMLDRMGRNMRTDLFIDDLTAAGAVLVDASDEQISGNRSQRRAMRAGVANARNESDIISERVTNGIAGRWEEVNEQWGRPPLGFHRAPSPDGRYQLTHIDQQTIGEAVAMFERYATGTVSFEQLARETGRNANTIKSILANPIYNGWARYHRGQDAIRRPTAWRINPPVSDDLWNRVQAVRARRTRAGGAKPRERVNAYEGLLYCATCDTRLSLDGFDGTGRNTYHRLRHHNPCSGWGSVQRRPLKWWTDALEYQLSHVTIDQAAIADVVRVLTADRRPSNVTPLRFRQQRNEVAARLVGRRINATTAQAELDAIDAAEEASRAQPVKPGVTADQVVTGLQDFNETWQLGTPQIRANLVQAIYDKVRVQGDGKFAGEDAITLTSEALSKGFARLLPQEIPVQGRIACPRGLEPPTFRSAT